MTSIEPGPVLTKFAENASIGNLQQTAEGLDESSVNQMKKMNDGAAATFKELGQQGEDIAKIIQEAITANKPHAKYMTNPKFVKLLESKYSDLTGDNGINAAIDWFKLG